MQSDLVTLNALTQDAGQPILFLHGFPDFSYSWHQQLTAFESRYKVIAPDLLGYNLSAKPKDLADYRLMSLVKSIINFIDTNNISNKKIILVGHDWGGLIAWTLASSFPNYFEKLIIINAPHPIAFEQMLISNAAQQKASQYIKFFLQPNAAQVLAANEYQALQELFITPGLKSGAISQQDQAKYVTAWSQPQALESMLKYYQASFIVTDQGIQFKHGLTDFKKIDLPTLLIWGEQDRAIVTDNIEAIKPWVSNLEVVRVPQNSHWIVHENPILINECIMSFITSEVE